MSKKTPTPPKPSADPSAGVRCHACGNQVTPEQIAAGAPCSACGNKQPQVDE